MPLMQVARMEMGIRSWGRGGAGVGGEGGEGDGALGLETQK